MPIESPRSQRFGTSGLPMTRAEYARRIETWEKWNDVSVEAQGAIWPQSELASFNRISASLHRNSA
jgi:hypothetical protein